MNSCYNLNKRIDCILIWGHGLNYFDDILDIIRQKEYFRILKIQKYHPRSIKKLVKKIYSYDYAPFWHLKSKTKYLLKSPHEVCFIFVENKFPKIDIVDEGRFRHEESLTIKALKDEVRKKFNPYIEGEMTHNHVIHGTDNIHQTDQILKILGYKNGVNIFSGNNIIPSPYYIPSINECEITKLPFDELYGNIAKGTNWNSFTIESTKICETPHYLGLTKDWSYYDNYIKTFIGGPLQEDYNINRYSNLASNFKYLNKEENCKFVIIKEINNRNIIMDGLHRACIHLSQGNDSILVCKIIK